MEVYLVIDDYTPDAGSTVYGAFATKELAQGYIDTEMGEEYGEEYATESNAYVESFTVHRK